MASPRIDKRSHLRLALWKQTGLDLLGDCQIVRSLALRLAEPSAAEIKKVVIVPTDGPSGAFVGRGSRNNSPTARTYVPSVA
jgi:hypothetical protein